VRKEIAMNLRITTQPTQPITCPVKCYLSSLVGMNDCAEMEYRAYSISELI